LDKDEAKEEAAAVEVATAEASADLQPESVSSVALAMRLPAQMVVQMMDCRMLPRARMVEWMQVMNVPESPVEI
jgi:hypothetical protein